MPGRSTGDLKATIDIPAAGPWFEGHFAGKPILPGVAELTFAIGALRRKTGKAMPLRGVNFARLRHLVLPGDRLELSARENAGMEGETARLRFELERDGVLVANGEFIIGPPPPPDGPRERSSPAHPGDNLAAANFPPLDALLPHRPPMRFVESVLRQSADALDCIARIPAACALVSGGAAPAMAAIEAAAQAAAAWEALRRWHKCGEAGPRMGYLVAMRDISFCTEQIPAGASLHVSVRLEAVSPPLSHYRFDVSLDGLRLVQGAVGTFLAE